MIRIKNPKTNRDILIMWRHLLPQQSNNPSTTCIICDGNKESVIVDSTALKSKHDQFNRKIGRDVSFRRAMNCIKENELFDKQERGLIWNEYFKTHNKVITS